jgi:hypothetical protein
LDATHFGVDEEGNTVLMGLGNMSFLPATFARYTLVNANFDTLADTLRLSGATDMRTLSKISHNLGMTADETLGASIYLDLRWRERFRLTFVILGLNEYGKTPGKGTKDTGSGDL